MASHILDVGGGTGIIAQMFADEGKGVTVLDPSMGMLARIKDSAMKKIVGKAQSLPFKAGSFDLVYCVDSLHHFTNGAPKSDWDAIMKGCMGELLRIMKPGGTLAIVEIDIERMWGRFVAFGENAVFRMGSRFYARKELEGLFPDRKLTTTDIGGICYLTKVSA